MHGSTFGLGSLYHNGLRHFESEQNLFCSDFFERECLFTQRVLLYFLVAYVLLLHFKVEEPLHLMRAPF